MGNCCDTNSNNNHYDVRNKAQTPQLQLSEVIHGYIIQPNNWNKSNFNLCTVLKENTTKPILLLKRVNIDPIERKMLERINRDELNNHKNIVFYHDLMFSNDKNYFYVVMDLYDKNFGEFFSEKRRKRDDILNYVYQICSALSHLHKLNLTHGNLNPYKILVNELNSIPTMLKVTAFGFKSPSNKGSLYFSPEQNNNNNQNFEISTAVDIWALGVMFYEMVNDNIIDIDMKTIPRNQIEFRNPEFNNEEDLKILISMIEMDPGNRIIASDLKRKKEWHRQSDPQ